MSDSPTPTRRYIGPAIFNVAAAFGVLLWIALIIACGAGAVK